MDSAESENSRKCVEEARRSSDSVMAFIYDRLTEEKGSWIARSAVCDEYEAY
ncbi:MAG: hypothetical protein SOI56_07585 [Eubacteriales bacterium]